jgi:hypothetical protein
MKNWKNFEKITEQVINILLKDNIEFICSGPDCKLKSKSEECRQFDMLYRYKNAFTKNNLIAIECKNHKNPIDINYVDSFNSACDSCNISNKFMFSSGGFTKGARNQAKFFNITLIELRDFRLEDLSDTFRKQIHQIKLSIFTHQYSTIVKEFNVACKNTEDAGKRLYAPEGTQIFLKDGRSFLLPEFLPPKNDIKNFTNKQENIYEYIIENAYYIKNNETKIEVENIAIVIERKLVTHVETGNIDFSDDFVKKGYMIAKKIAERGNFVIDLGIQIVVDSNI